MFARRAVPRLQRPWFQQQPTFRLFSTAELNNGIRMAYDLHEPPQEDGKKNAPIVFIHGLFGSMRNNRSMIFARDLNRPVYAIDLRNHGDSSHDPRHDYTALAEDVESFITKLALKESTLIGHSMGAKTVMAVALRKRVPVANIVSVDNAPIDAALKSDFHQYVRGMQKIEEAGCKKQSEADKILQEYEQSLPIRQFLLTNLARDQATGLQRFRVPLKYLAGALDNMADFPFNDPDEARFEKPTLFVRGTHSHYVADEFLPLIGRFFPKFELVDVDSGHWIISEKPEEFRKAVVDFLQDKE